jgi:glycosyltransferase involved in cell wall biosynthesis
MKILVLSNLYPPVYVGGYELHCQTIVEALRARGHDVEVLTTDHQADKTDAQPGVSRTLKIHGLFGHPFLGILKLKDLEFHNNRALFAALEKFKPDIVYAWNFGGLSKSMLFSLQRLGVPVVFAVCDHWIARSQYADVWINWWNRENASLQHRFLRGFWTLNGQRRACQLTAPTNPISHLRFQRIHFCSQALRDFTAAQGYDVRHANIIYCPINIEKFDASPRPHTEPLQRLLYVGRLNEDKGIWTALRAMALVRDKFAGELRIFGSGEPAFEKKLAAFVQENVLPVTFHASAPTEKMPEIYREHDALLFTSEWPEPFALTPLEAMASGLPVIGTTTGGSAELFKNHENALTYTAGKPDELARCILELAGDGILRERIAARGREEVRARFAEKIIVDQIEELLENTVKTWVPAPLPHYTS